jgi:hypothetical protein
MERHELIAALAWTITCMSQDNKNAEDIFQILKKKSLARFLVEAYRECCTDAELRRTFFPS